MENITTEVSLSNQNSLTLSTDIIGLTAVSTLISFIDGYTNVMVYDTLELDGSYNTSIEAKFFHESMLRELANNARGILDITFELDNVEFIH